MGFRYCYDDKSKENLLIEKICKKHNINPIPKVTLVIEDEVCASYRFDIGGLDISTEYISFTENNEQQILDLCIRSIEDQKRYDKEKLRVQRELSDIPIDDLIQSINQYENEIENLKMKFNHNEESNSNVGIALKCISKRMESSKLKDELERRKAI